MKKLTEEDVKRGKERGRNDTKERETHIENREIEVEKIQKVPRCAPCLALSN